MGCVKSKEDKGPSLKYRPDASNPTPVPSHMGHYGPDPTQMGQSPVPKGPNNSYNSHASAITPFGGSSSVITPFGGASSSFSTVTVSNPFPGGVTGGCLRIVTPVKNDHNIGHRGHAACYCIFCLNLFIQSFYETHFLL